MPVTKFDQTYKFLLGIVSIRVFIEDRRPDLEEYPTKYKTFLLANGDIGCLLE